MKRTFHIILLAALAAFALASCTKEEAPQTYLEILSSDVDFPAAGGAGTIVISTNAASVSAASDKPWLTVGPVGTQSVAFTVEESTNEFSRTAIVTIEADGVTQEVTVSQMSVVMDITTDVTDMNIDPTGGNVEINYSFSGASEPQVIIPETVTWLSYSFSDGVLTLSAPANTTGTLRKAPVAVVGAWKSVDFTVSQDRVPMLNTVTFTYNRTAVTETVEPTEYAADINWTLRSNADWITVEKTAGGLVSFSLTENESGAVRTGTFDMLDGSGNVIETVTITQRTFNYDFFLGDWTLSCRVYDLKEGAEYDVTYTVTFTADDEGTGYVMSGLPLYSTYTSGLSLSYDESGENPTMTLLSQISGLRLSAGSTTLYVGVLACNENTSFYYSAESGLCFEYDETAGAFSITGNDFRPTMSDGTTFIATGLVGAAFTSTTMSSDTRYTFTVAYTEFYSMYRE